MRIRDGRIILVLILLLTGCSAIPHGSSPSPKPLSDEIRHSYDYDQIPLQAVMTSSENASGYQVRHLQLSSASENSSIQPIRIDWYKPNKTTRRPAILLSPILAGNDLYVCEFARFYAARGLHAVIVYRPQEIFSPDRDLKDIETHFHESITGLRRTIDWLETEDSVDPARIGSFGISLGALITPILGAVDPRVKAQVFGLPACHVAEIIMTSQDKAIRKRRRAYLEKHGWTVEKGLEELQKVIISEPLRFAPSLDPRRCLVIIGLFDRVLGAHRSFEIWRAMGKPQLVLLPTGHYTSALATPYLKIVTYSFFSRKLSLDN